MLSKEKLGKGTGYEVATFCKGGGIGGLHPNPEEKTTVPNGLSRPIQQKLRQRIGILVIDVTPGSSHGPSQEEKKLERGGKDSNILQQNHSTNRSTGQEPLIKFAIQKSERTLADPRTQVNGITGNKESAEGGGER